MKTSELIAILQDQMAEYGDLEVRLGDDHDDGPFMYLEPGDVVWAHEENTDCDPMWTVDRGPYP